MIKLIMLITLFNVTLFANWKSERENLDKVYILNEFRLFYSLNGKHSIVDKSDVNKNNIPDIVENVALQFDVSNKIFKNVLKFKSPLKQERYKTQKVKTIDIHFFNLSYSGNSGDGVITYKYKIIKEYHNALSIAISNKIKVGNLTPAHELFHTYQNGYTMFKNRWFTEGTARWSEKIFEKGTGKQKKLPSTVQDIQKLLTKTYDAKYFWNRLVRICTKQPKVFNIPKSLKHITYIKNSQFVIEGNDIYGIDFMKLFFLNLDYYDDKATKDMGYKKYRWKESQQKYFKNNIYILNAIKRTIKQIKPKKSKEIESFLDVLNQYLQEAKKTNKIVDLSNNIKEIGIPYKNKYKNNTEDVYSRNVWDIKAFDGKLYFGAGNSSNSRPSPNAGPVPVISYDIKSKKMIDEYIVDEEAIELFRILDNKLFIPGADATQSHKFGNFYIKDKNKKWKKYRNILKGLHIYDMIFFDGKLFAAISTNKGAGVAISDDFGKSWKIEQLGKYQRVFTFLLANHKLYAVKQLLHNKKIDKLVSKTKKKYFFIAEYKNGTFVARRDLTKRNLFPYKKLNKNRTLRISKSEVYKNSTIYIGSYYYDVPFSFFITSNLDNSNVQTKSIKIPKSYTPRDLIVKNDKVYLLISRKNYKKYENIILEIVDDNFENPIGKFKFMTNTIVRSFELVDNNFYFGLGTNVKNKKKWKQKELHPNSGKVIMIKYSKNRKI